MVGQISPLDVDDFQGDLTKNYELLRLILGPGHGRQGHVSYHVSLLHQVLFLLIGE
jgi:hypothetical protein